MINTKKCPTCQGPAEASTRAGILLVDVACAACGGLRTYAYILAERIIPELPAESRERLQAALRLLPDPLPVTIDQVQLSVLISFGEDVPRDLYGPVRKP